MIRLKMEFLRFMGITFLSWNMKITLSPFIKQHSFEDGHGNTAMKGIGADYIEVSLYFTLSIRRLETLCGNFCRERKTSLVFYSEDTLPSITIVGWLSAVRSLLIFYAVFRVVHETCVWNCQ